jgi:hypothetical protein
MARPMPKQLKMTNVKKAPGRPTTTDLRPGDGAGALSLSPLSPLSPRWSRWSDTRASYHGTEAGADGITTFARG